MKKNPFSKKAIVTTAAASFLSMISMHGMAAEEKYTIDPMHSFVVWRVDHLGFSKQTGKWPINGFILLDQNDPAKSKVTASIKINDLVTGIAELNKHLEGSIFFDSAKYPEAIFTSQSIKLESKKSADITGNLTLHGVTKSISIPVTLNKLGQNPVNEKMAVGFSAETSIKRSDFDIKGFLPMVGDTVHLLVDVEAHKTAA